MRARVFFASHFGLASVAATLSVAGCAKPHAIEWGGQAAFAPAKGALRLQRDADQRPPFTEKDYVTLALSRIHLSGIPGAGPGTHVVVGVSVRGALPGDAVASTVAGVLRLDAQGTGELRHDAAFGPFPFRGDVAVELVVLPIPEGEEANLRGRIQGAQGLLRQVRLYSGASVSTARSLYASIFGAFRRGGPRPWKASFVLHASRPDDPHAPQLLRGETILVWQPRKSAPAALRAQLAPEALARALTAQIDSLSWKESGAPFREAPFCALTMLRSRRLGWEGNPARSGIREAVELAKKGEHDKALDRLDATIVFLRDRSELTNAERSLLVAFAELERAEVGIVRAEAKRDGGALRAARRAKLEVVRRILRAQDDLLDPDERGNLRAEEKELLRAIGR